MAPYSELNYAVEDRVATITFNRPERNNAWTPLLEEELRAAILKAGADEAVRAIVLTGAGASFCVGADRAALQTASERGEIRAKPACGGGEFEQRYSYLLACPKPLIAAINGPTAGVGFCLILYCDLRYIAVGARISTAFSRVGLPAEHGSAWLLPRLIGPMNALDMLLSGRPFTSGEVADVGLARELDADGFLASVQARAAEIANLTSPLAVSAIKRQVHTTWGQTLPEAIQAGDVLKAAAVKTEDFKEGVAHMVEKRRPAFPGR